jgi:hypothetical protein
MHTAGIQVEEQPLMFRFGEECDSLFQSKDEPEGSEG